MTYAGTNGRDEVDPVNWILHREWVLAREAHPLSVRRAETTKAALESADTPSNHLRLALGVAVGAVLAAGAFVASPLTGTNEGVNSTGASPERAFIPLEQRIPVTEPSAEAPAPVPAPPPAPAPAPAPAPVNEHPQQTAPAATEPQAVAAPDHAVEGDNQLTAPNTNTPAPAPAPSQNQQWGSGDQWGSGTQWGSGGQWGSGSQWGYGSQWGSVPQWGYGQPSYGQWGYDTQQWSPVSGFGAPTSSSYSAATSTPAGPAMSMLDPFCH